MTLTAKWIADSLRLIQAVVTVQEYCQMQREREDGKGCSDCIYRALNRGDRDCPLNDYPNYWEV